MASKKLALNASDLQVTSFAPDDSVSAAQEQMVGGDSVAPYCIVYVSDCVACY